MLTIDKAIKLDFQCIKERFVFVLFLTVIMVILSSAGFFSLAFMWPFLFIIFITLIYQEYKIEKILFVDSLFGDGVSLYRTLPVDTDEMIISKLFLGWLSVFISVGSTVFCLMSMFGIPFLEIAITGYVYRLLGLLYGYGIAVAMVVFFLIVLHSFAMVVFVVAQRAAVYKNGGKYKWNEYGVYWWLMLVKYILTPEILQFAAGYGTTVYWTVIAADFVVSMGLSVYAVRYIKDVVEGRC